MKVTDIPFVSHVGIKVDAEQTLTLTNIPPVQNHLQTIHAAAQFALAETQSGYYLQSLFPDLQDEVIPLLRSSEVKYKQPATTQIYTRAFAEETALTKFHEQFSKKGRATIKVYVEVVDIHETVTMEGVFGWFVQRR